MPYKFIVEIKKAIHSNKSCIKRERKPNFLKKKKNLQNFISVKESVLEEIRLALHLKNIAQEEYDEQMAILEENRRMENAAYEVINKEHKRNTQEDMDMDDEYKRIEDDIRSKVESNNNE